ncbi:hypothetical protein FOCC_FOCC011702, partial [Frankliniella occidentalis]
NASAQAALQAAQALSGSTPNEVQGGPNTVLRVIVEHMVYPVTLDVLHQLFSRFGKVLKIVTFTKNNSFQALIQYPDVVTAQSAKLSLDGQNIYNSCCTLRIEYSKLSNLNVKYNNDKSRDYTNPGLPTGDAGMEMGSMGALGPLGLGMAGLGAGAAGVLASPFAAMHGLGSPLTGPYGNSAVGAAAAGMPLAGFSLPGAANALGAAGLRLTGQPGGSCVLLVSNLNEEMVTPDALFTLFGVYGDVQRVKILYNKKDSALIQMAEPHQANLAMTHMDKLRMFGKQIRVMPSKHLNVQLPKEGQPDAGLTKDYTTSPLHRFKKPGSKNYQNIYPPSATLHLSNIPPSVSEEEITEAFAKNGFQVKGFKFFPSFGKLLKEDASESVLELSSDLPGLPYASSLLFALITNKIYHPPHYLPTPYTLSFVLLRRRQAKGKRAAYYDIHFYKQFRIFLVCVCLYLFLYVWSCVYRKDRKMALIQLSSMDEAVSALIKMHNYQLSEQNHLRVSFSKSNI